MTSSSGSAASTINILESPWSWWRKQMPVTNQWAYFDHAAVAPLSRPAATAIAHYATQAAEQGDMAWPQWAAKIGRLRGQFADLMHCEISEVCIVPNTTTGINLVAEGWPWQPGDNVVIPEGEFPSNLFPWQNQQSRGVELRIVPRRNGEVRVADLLAHVDSNTKIISTSWIGYASGYRIALQQLVDEAHRRGILVFLDAIQGLGMHRLDLRETPVDFLAADGHKWLLGPEGAGVAMIAQRHLERLRCGNVGWGSVRNPFDYANPNFDLRGEASRFESGSANMVGVAALSESVQLFLEVQQAHGPDAIADRVIELTNSLDRRLRSLGAKTRFPSERKHQSGIISFTLPGIDPADFRKRAIQQKVVLSVRDSGIRAAVHAYNDESDLERLLSVVESMG